MKINKNIEDHLCNGQTIAISGIDSSYYPKELIRKIKNSGVNNLTLIYIENNAVHDPESDPMDLILNGQVSKLITSHLGAMNKNFGEYLDGVELLPMDILSLKLQSGANRYPGGLAIEYDYAKLYRDQDWLDKHSFEVNGQMYAYEEPLNADIGIISVDNIDLSTYHCSWDGTNYNAVDVARCSSLCFAEYHKNFGLTFDEVQLPGQYVDGAIAADTVEYQKTNW